MHICFVDEATFEGMHLDDADCFVVEGVGSLFNTFGVLTPEFDKAFEDEFRVLPTAGTLGLTSRGMVVACQQLCTGREQFEALRAAALALAQSDDAITRRLNACRGSEWLERLAMLPDTRAESCNLAA